MSHTPGPWKVNVRGTVPLIIHKGDLRFPIAVVGEVYMIKAERLDNARLIAAAPDLLEACKALTPQSPMCLVCQPFDNEHMEFCPVPLALVAIAKVEGS